MDGKKGGVSATFLKRLPQYFTEFLVFSYKAYSFKNNVERLILC